MLHVGHKNEGVFRSGRLGSLRGETDGGSFSKRNSAADVVGRELLKECCEGTKMSWVGLL